MEEILRPDEEIIELTRVVQDEPVVSKTKPASRGAEKSQPQKVSFSEEGISSEVIEKAIEKWIQKEFQHKIEPLMQDAVERVLQREIRRIKWDIEKKMSRIQMVAEQE